MDERTGTVPACSRAAASAMRRSRRRSTRPVVRNGKGRDVLEVSRPHEFEELARTLHPRDMRVFRGACDPDAEPIGFAERFGARFTKLAAIRAAIPSGDFRDLPAIEAWADGIAHELLVGTVATGR